MTSHIIVGDFNLPDICWSTLSGTSPFSNSLCDLVLILYPYFICGYPEDNLKRAHLLSLKVNFQFKLHKDKLCKSLCKERQSEKVLQVRGILYLQQREIDSKM